MKAILVIDEMPKDCGDCRLISCIGDKAFCDALIYAHGGLNKPEIHIGDKPNWCPLKPMPQKENEFDKCLNDYGRGWRIGYNHCIDEILGEEE